MRIKVKLDAPPPSAMAGRPAARRGAKEGLEGGSGPHVRGEAPSRKTRRPRRVFGVRGCLWRGKRRTGVEMDAPPLCTRAERLGAGMCVQK